jgi:hypothetical protein
MSSDRIGPPFDSGSDVQRTPTRLIRWSWEHQHADETVSGGWTLTKRGARREVAKAEARDYERTGRHAYPAVRWARRDA